MIVVTSPETAVDEALEGLVMLHPGLRLLQDHRVVVREKVSLLIWCWSSWCEYVCSFCLSIWFQVTNWQKNAFPDWEWEGSTDFWRRLRAWTLLCRIYWYIIWYIGQILGILVRQLLTNLPKNTKQKTTVVIYLWPILVSNVSWKLSTGDGMLTGGVAGSVFASPPTGGSLPPSPFLIYQTSFIKKYSFWCSIVVHPILSPDIIGCKISFDGKCCSLHIGRDQSCGKGQSRFATCLKIPG